MEENQNPVEENKASSEPIKVPEVIAGTPSNIDSPNNSAVGDNTPGTPTMEVHHHPELHHKPKPWKEYFLEFIMIVLAVTTGFVADNLRENIADREKEKQAISSLVNCLADDTTQLNNVIQSNHLVAAYSDSITTLKNADLTTEENKRKFYEYTLTAITQDPYFKTNDAAMLQLKSAGIMRLIKKQNILDSILGYELKNKATLAQEADCYFLFKESMLDCKKVVNFIAMRDTAFSSPPMPYGFFKIRLKKTAGLTINNDKEKLDALFNDGPIMGIVIDFYIGLLKDQQLYAKRLIAILKKEYKLESE